MVRCKFRCIERKETGTHYGPKEGGTKSQESVTLAAVSGPSNESWSKYTPSGQLTMTITNPAALDQFKVGEEYFIDIHPATEEG